tara:strand:+ start:2734 stop:4131 length:1398 start_codon:yes stop_codon:yes gene_type:complete
MDAGKDFRVRRGYERYFYSVYRPIIYTAQSNDSDVAFARGELYIEEIWDSGNFVSTGILLDGYGTPMNPNTYQFNVMEHCRHFVGKSDFLDNSGGGAQYTAQDECKRFYLRMWAVRYSGVTANALYDDDDGAVDGRTFIGVDCTTHDTQAYEPNDRHGNICNLVMGDNGWVLPKNHQLLTEMPPGSFNNPVQTINMDEDQDNSLYTLFHLNKNHDKAAVVYMGYKDDTFVGYVSAFPIMTSQYFRIPLHPRQIEKKLLQWNGAVSNMMVDASGVLQVDKIAVYIYNYGTISGLIAKPESYDYTSGVQSTDVFWFNITEKKNDGHCNKTKFIFKNHLGGYDFFNCYGTISKSVSVSGQEYDRYNGIASTYIPQQAHNTKMLWTSRDDEYSVFSQPLNKEKADWLADLVSSSQVWVEEVLKDGQYYNKIRVPIIIEPGTYKLHNTEDSNHFIQFKYKKSSARTTQRN